MRILIVHASKHGATAGIAERIGATLTAAGHEVDVRPAREVPDPSTYDAVVVGSAAYLGRWLKDATEFVRRHRTVLDSRPVWLFSSGPIGEKTTNEEGRDLREVSDPRELPELVDALQPRDHRVFFGALDPSQLTLAERALRRLPAGRELLPEGDFRDWSDVESWAEEIAGQLQGGS
ncbi:flavodoxin domain-containing protein [Nocardioides dilutus]